MTPRSRWLAATSLLLACWACSSPSGCGGCTAFQQYPQGTYSGPKMDSAGAVRLSAAGFGVLNANSTGILQAFAPGNHLVVPVPCSVQAANIAGFPIAQLTIADEGGLGCSAESCGQLDGKCDSKDVPHDITITISSLTFAPKAPDVVEAHITATVQTGPLMVSSTSRSSLLCAFSGGGPVKCSVDFDTGRAAPTTNDLAIQIQLAIDTKWDKLLNLTVSDIGGTKACGATQPQPCLDPADIIIAAAGTTCQSLCGAGNFSVVKQLLLDQLTKSLKDQLDTAVKKANCAPCGAAGQCPTSTQATAQCVGQGDGGVGQCVDTVTGVCIPRLLGVEGHLDVGTALGGFGAPPGAGIDLAIGAGGAAAADQNGATVGLRGGSQTIAIADCVKPAQRPMPQNLPLPNFDLDAPATPYDVAFSVSQQLISEALFQAQQSGALCLELGQESISQLDSSLLSALLPSLGKVTHGDSVPLRVVIRPVNAPTAVVGHGTFDSMGKPLDPLLRLNWQGLEVDLYAQLDDRYVRLFTLSADLSLPLGLRADCTGVTPVIGDITTAVTNVNVKNSEILAENLDALKRLVPALLALAEPALASGLPSIAIPDLPGLTVKLKLLSAQGVGQISGTSQYNHLGIYAAFYNADAGCPVSFRSFKVPARVVAHEGSQLHLAVPDGMYSVRIDRGFFSLPVRASGGLLMFTHPRLMLGGTHRVELLDGDGAAESLWVP